MRIAYVIPAWPPLGSQPFVVNEMVEVQDAGHALVVLPLYPGEAGGVRHGTFARLRPASVLPAPLVDGATLGLALRVLVTRPWRVLRTLAGAHRAAGASPWAHVRLLAVTPKALAAAHRLRALGVEHLHAHFAMQTADTAAIAGAVAGVPFSFTAHAYDIYSTHPRWRNATLGWKLRRAARAFTVNDYARDLLRAMLPAAERARVQTVYVGIPTELFHAEPPAPDDGRLRLLCVARFQEKKGIDTLIDACAVLRERGCAFSLRVFGDGPLRPALEAQVARHALGDHVLIGQPIPQEEVAREMRACHLFVMPCRRDHNGDMDGIPTVFMEAMATGRPVVSCAVSGIPELVRDGETGVIVPPNDTLALADAIADLATAPERRAFLGRQGRALVERQHDQRRNARRVVALLVSDGSADAPAAGATRPAASSR
ncbi:MAG: glycosyltransferase [bacterium]|nr:glycosyltransferase [bacterium]